MSQQLGGGMMRSLLQHNVPSSFSRNTDNSLGRQEKDSRDVQHDLESKSRQYKRSKPLQHHRQVSVGLDSRVVTIEERLDTLERDNFRLRQELDEQRSLILQKNTNQQGDGGLSTSSSTDQLVTRLAERSDAVQLANTMANRAQVLEQEQQKSAVLFAEVVRLGRSLSELQRQVESERHATNATVQQLNDRVQSSESVGNQGIGQQQALETRTRHVVDSLHSELQSTQQTVQELRQHIAHENSARRVSEIAHVQVLDYVKEALKNADWGLHDRLDKSIADLHSQLALDQSTERNNRAVDRADYNAKQFETKESISNQLELLTKRLGDLNRSLDNESQRREEQMVAVQMQVDREMDRLKSSLTEEQVCRAQGLRGVRVDVEGSLDLFRGMIQEQSNQSAGSQESLEEILRAEVRARLRHEAKARERLENTVAAISVSIEEAKVISNETIERTRHGIYQGLNEANECVGVLTKQVQVLGMDRGRRSEFLTIKARCEVTEKRLASEVSKRDSQLQGLGYRVDALDGACNSLQEQVDRNLSICKQETESLRTDTTLRIVQLDEKQSEALSDQDSRLSLECTKAEARNKNYIRVLRSDIESTLVNVQETAFIFETNTTNALNNLGANAIAESMVIKLEFINMDSQVREISKKCESQFEIVRQAQDIMRGQHVSKMTEIETQVHESNQENKDNFLVLDSKLEIHDTNLTRIRKECMTELIQVAADARANVQATKVESAARDETVSRYVREVEVAQVLDRMISQVTAEHLANVTLEHGGMLQLQSGLAEKRYGGLESGLKDQKVTFERWHKTIEKQLEDTAVMRKAQQAAWQESLNELEETNSIINAGGDGAVSVQRQDSLSSIAQGEDDVAKVPAGPSVADVGMPSM